MLNRPLSGWFRPPYRLLTIALLLTSPFAVAPSQLTLAQSIDEIAPKETIPQPLPSEDPLNSPYPLPWKWVMDTQANVRTLGAGVRYYRSSAVVSPDGQYAAYSRIQLLAQPELYRSRITSTMFIENLRTGDLHQLKSSFPHSERAVTENVPGTISVLTPIGWSRKSDRLLARRFEGIFNSSDATDVAVIWDRQHNRSTSVAPAQNQHSHEIAILLGWSHTDSNQVLFRAGNLGDQQWSLWKVAVNGQTSPATNADRPLIFGQKLSRMWTGSQVAYR